jgi:hypothetical protein
MNSCLLEYSLGLSGENIKLMKSVKYFLIFKYNMFHPITPKKIFISCSDFIKSVTQNRKHIFIKPINQSVIKFCLALTRQQRH